MILAAGLARQSSANIWTPYPGIWNNSDKASGAVVATGGFLLTSSSTGVGGARGTVALSGKMYWSLLVTVSPGSSHTVGIANTSMNISANTPIDSANGWGYYGNDGKFYNGGAAVGTGATYAIIVNLITVAVDISASSIWFAKDGVWLDSGNPLTGANPIFTNLSGTLYPWAGDITSTVASKYMIAPPGQTAVGLA